MPREYPIEKTRNIGIIAHIDAGKTTTTETILFYTGKTHRIGNIDVGDTQMDWMEQERERGITIQSAATTCFWSLTRLGEGHKPTHQINIIDTPGHVDFTAEVERSLRVLDGAVVVFDGKAGVEPQSETVWRQADKYNVPRVCLVNKINQTGGDFYMSLDSIRDRLSKNASPIMLPIGAEENLCGWVDLVGLRAYIYKDKDGLETKETEIPEDMKEIVEKYREELIDMVVDADEGLVEKYLSDGVLDEDELREAIRISTISGKFFPVMGGDGRKVVARVVLDAILDYLPSPLDVPPVRGTNPKTGADEERSADDSDSFCALAFKIASDPYVGTLTYFRVYSGTLKKGSYVLNTTSGEKERIGRILRMHAQERKEEDEIFAGDIAATVGLKSTSTGHTLCDMSAPIVLEKISFPEPVISVRIEPKSKAEQEKMGIALRKLAAEDPTFRIGSNQETGETIISGMGELHLEIIADRLKREFNFIGDVGKPQVAYKETIKKEAEAEAKYIKQSGGKGQYGHVKIRIKPNKKGAGFKFINEIKGGIIPREFIPAVEKGIKEAMDRGVLAGYPLIDLEATLYDGSFHDVDSSELAFNIAGSMALQDAAKKAGVILLEPVMNIEVVVPAIFFGDIIANLSSRRAKIKETSDRGELKVIDADVPISEMFGYATALRSLTEGRGTFTMEFSHYEKVPSSITEEVIEGKRS